MILKIPLLPLQKSGNPKRELVKIIHKQLGEVIAGCVVCLKTTLFFTSAKSHYLHQYCYRLCWCIINKVKQDFNLHSLSNMLADAYKSLKSISYPGSLLTEISYVLALIWWACMNN